MSALEEITMVDFEPTGDFVARTMEDIRAYEREMGNKRERINTFLFSKPGRLVLITGGILLGALNLFRMAAMLISPALCL